MNNQTVFSNRQSDFRRFSRFIRMLCALAFVGWLNIGAAIPPLLNVQQVSVGGYHVCAIVNGGAQCWGYNYDGQLGDGDYLDSGFPVPVTGLQTGVTAISAGAYHTCAIVAGSVKCWGRNPDGELGNGSTLDSNVPVTVAGLSGIVAISAGQYHTCAMTSAGTVRCWGWNANGQLGDGTINATNTGSPTTVSNIASGATMLASGGYHTCALVAGAVKCWGYNNYGELADGSIAESHVPVSATGLSGVTTIAAGLYHTCAIVTGGGVKCWGLNTDGQLGDNSTTSTATGAPAAVSNISSGATALAIGGFHSCAIVSGAEKCWGNNVLGQLGNSSLGTSHVPVAVAGLSSGVTAISSGIYDSCALVTVGGLHETKCWGDNLDGEMGLGDLLFQSTPVPVTGLSSGATFLASGAYSLHSCAIVGGAGKCWGDNFHGELGNGNNVDSSVPVSVSGLTSGVTAIADGANHTCAVVGGKAKCWGANDSGQLGNGSTADSTTPVVTIAANVTAIATGYAHSCAIVSGAVKCWGSNSSGELGNGSTTMSLSPVSVVGLSTTAIAISIGVAHTCAVLSNGKIQCWGYNSNGQLGNNTNVSTGANPPVTVAGISSGATAIAAGGYHTCAVVSGGVTCWGDGQNGQLGNASFADSFVPVAASGLSSGVSNVFAGNLYSCALASGTAYCWGGTHSVGGASGAQLSVPAALSFGAAVTSIGTGNSQGCAIVGGATLCVGADNFGQLGDGRSVFLESPGIVVEGDEVFRDNFEAN